MKTSALAAVLAVLSTLTPAAQAGGNGGSSGGDVHAQSPAAGPERGGQRFASGRGGISGEVYLPPKAHRMFAGGKGGMTGEFHAKLTTHRLFAGGGVRGGDPFGRSAALYQGGAEYRIAASKPNSGGDINV